jgi:hypothetical protein
MYFPTKKSSGRKKKKKSVVVSSSSPPDCPADVAPSCAAHANWTSQPRHGRQTTRLVRFSSRHLNDLPPPLDPILACMLNLRRATAAAAVDGLWFSFFSTTTTAGGAMEEEKPASPVSRHIMPHLLNMYVTCSLLSSVLFC